MITIDDELSVALSDIDINSILDARSSYKAQTYFDSWIITDNVLIRPNRMLDITRDERVDLIEEIVPNEILEILKSLAVVIYEPTDKRYYWTDERYLKCNHADCLFISKLDIFARVAWKKYENYAEPFGLIYDIQFDEIRDNIVVVNNTPISANGISYDHYSQRPQHSKNRSWPYDKFVKYVQLILQRVQSP